jgi:hypothetical protein
MFITDPDLDFLPIPDPGVKKAPNPGSATLPRRPILSCYATGCWLSRLG